MEGPFGDVDPDTVEADVGNIWRTLYKLEKSFSETPLPKEMAAKVRHLKGSYMIRPYAALDLKSDMLSPRPSVADFHGCAKPNACGADFNISEILLQRLVILLHVHVV